MRIFRWDLVFRVPSNFDEIEQFIFNVDVGADRHWQWIFRPQILSKFQLAFFDAETGCRGLLWLGHWLLRCGFRGRGHGLLEQADWNTRSTWSSIVEISFASPGYGKQHAMKQNQQQLHVADRRKDLFLFIVVATLFSLSLYSTIGVAERAVVTYVSEA
jgi:hypothetical protein